MSNRKLELNLPCQESAPGLATLDIDKIDWESFNRLTEGLLSSEIESSGAATDAPVDRREDGAHVHNSRSIAYGWLENLSLDEAWSPSSLLHPKLEWKEMPAMMDVDDDVANVPMSMMWYSDSVSDSIPTVSDGASSCDDSDKAVPKLAFRTTQFGCDETSQCSTTTSTTSEKSTVGSQGRFWLYNQQSKGPKAQKFNLNLHIETETEEKPMAFTDPVFDRTVTEVDIPHVGKARKGDGNNINPNPSRLHGIGVELEFLSSKMKDSHGNQKEKNRLISKACRLKKKAFNEAMKVQFHLLSKEKGELQNLLAMMKQEMKSPGNHSRPLLPLLRSLKSRVYRTRAAGKLTEAVDEVLQKVSDGDQSGGLNLTTTSLSQR